MQILPILVRLKRTIFGVFIIIKNELEVVHNIERSMVVFMFFRLTSLFRFACLVDRIRSCTKPSFINLMIINTRHVVQNLYKFYILNGNDSYR